MTFKLGLVLLQSSYESAATPQCTFLRVNRSNSNFGPTLHARMLHEREVSCSPWAPGYVNPLANLMAGNAQDHLFISYASEDQALAKWLALKLTAAGYRVWCDQFKLLGGKIIPAGH